MNKCLELFAGIGGWKKALDNIGIKNITIPAEIDKDTINVYSVINNSLINDIGFPVIDITKDKFNIDFKADIIFISPPCQGFSSARQNGININKERDNLIIYSLPIIEKIMPKYVIVENVPNFKKSEEYINWSTNMCEFGYWNKEEVLNSLNYNWPQNRKRFFAIWFRDKNDFDNYEWPEKEQLILSINDIIKDLPTEVHKYKPLPKNAKLRKNGNGYVWGNYIDNKCYLSNSYIGTITATFNQPWLLCGNNDMIRKLTWQECFLLMGYLQEDINKIQQLNLSNSKYKRMAGNSLVIPLIEKILKGLNYE